MGCIALEELRNERVSGNTVEDEKEGLKETMISREPQENLQNQLTWVMAVHKD